jgi:hypothetical protein
MIHVDALCLCMFMLRHAPLRVPLICITFLDGLHLFPDACLFALSVLVISI